MTFSVLMDFVVIATGYKNVIAYFPSSSAYDATLFLRPFATEVSLLVGAIYFFALIVTFLGRFLKAYLF